MGDLNSTLRAMSYDQMSAWQRHRPWLGRLLLALFFACALWLSITWMLSFDSERLSPGIAWLIFLALAASSVALVLSLFFMVLKLLLALRYRLRRMGLCTPKEKRVYREQQEFMNAQKRVAQLASVIKNQRWTAVPNRWNLVLGGNEQIVANASANYARFYGMNVSYSQTSGVFFGNTAFVAMGLFAVAFGNSSRRKMAAAAAQSQWREQQVVEVVVSNQRIICRRSDGQWLSFYLDAVSAFDIDVVAGQTVLQFHNAEPLLLGGEGGLLTALAIVWHSQGTAAIGTHQDLAPLKHLTNS